MDSEESESDTHDAHLRKPRRLLKVHALIKEEAEEAEEERQFHQRMQQRREEEEEEIRGDDHRRRERQRRWAQEGAEEAEHARQAAQRPAPGRQDPDETRPLGEPTGRAAAHPKAPPGRAPDHPPPNPPAEPQGTLTPRLGLPTGSSSKAPPPRRPAPGDAPEDLGKAWTRRPEPDDAPEDPATIFLLEKGFDILDVLHLQTKAGFWKQFKRYVIKSDDHYFVGDTARAQEGWQHLEEKARDFLARYPRPP